MNNNNTTYHPLGDYIRPVDVRNRDLQLTKLLGLSIEKCFIPSIANTIGTDMSTYKVVMPGQFAYGPVTSRNGDKITIALYTGDEPAIISQAYSVFEIVGECDTVETRRATSLQLLPEYLMMWFRRPEFDRYARYHSHGSAREIFDWAEMCATMVPVPPITEQRAVVADYEAVARRIAVAKRTIATLQATAQTLYRKMFVDGIDKENLPEGWRWGTLGEVCEFKYGKMADKHSKNKEFLFPIYSGYAVTGYTNICMFENPIVAIIARGDAGTGRICYSPKQCFLSNLAIAILPRDERLKQYLYFHLQDADTESLRSGSAQAQITINSLEPFEILIPKASVYSKFSSQADVIFNNIDVCEKEIEKLTEIQTIILSGMGR